MIDPRTLVERHQPPFVHAPGLRRRAGVWGLASGVVSPRIYLDPLALREHGAESLVYHEALHVHERHALAGLLLLAAGLVAVGVALSFGPLRLALAGPAAVAAWLWWRREQELRSDAFALRGAGRADFWCFTRMHPHPAGLFWRWCYGWSAQQRFERALRRASRRGWEVKA